MKVVSGGVPLLAEFNGIYFPIVSEGGFTFVMFPPHKPEQEYIK